MRASSDLTTGPIPVGQFVNLVRNTLRRDEIFQNQVITGEITQWKPHSNGHTYFTLVDSDGQISAVIWQGRCTIDPLIEEGSVVVVIANLDLWAKAGKIQLVVNRIELVNKLGVLEEHLLPVYKTKVYLTARKCNYQQSQNILLSLLGLVPPPLLT